MIHQGIARVNPPAQPRRDADRLFGPVEQIRARGVPPLVVPLFQSHRVGVVEDVIEPVVIEQPGRVHVEAALRREHELRAARLPIDLPHVARLSGQADPRQKRVRAILRNHRRRCHPGQCLCGQLFPVQGRLLEIDRTVGRTVEPSQFALLHAPQAQFPSRPIAERVGRPETHRLINRQPRGDVLHRLPVHFDQALHHRGAGC